jgi:hypothetical protein
VTSRSIYHSILPRVTCREFYQIDNPLDRAMFLSGLGLGWRSLLEMSEQWLLGNSKHQVGRQEVTGLRREKKQLKQVVAERWLYSVQGGGFENI